MTYHKAVLNRLYHSIQKCEPYQLRKKPRVYSYSIFLNFSFCQLAKVVQSIETKSEREHLQPFLTKQSPLPPQTPSSPRPHPRAQKRKSPSPGSCQHSTHPWTPSRLKRILWLHYSPFHSSSLTVEGGGRQGRLVFGYGCF